MRRDFSGSFRLKGIEGESAVFPPSTPYSEPSTLSKDTC